MGRARSEYAFGLATKHVHRDIQVTEAKLRDDLRGLLADHRHMLDSGLNIEVQQSPANWQNAMARVAITAPKKQPSSTLPLCDRWGDNYATQCTFVSKKVALNDVLGHDSRPSLPCATRVAAKATDVGPGCSMRAEMNSHWMEPVTYTQVCQGALDLGEAPSDQAADPIALQMDGERVWPPRALASEEDAAAVANLVKALCDSLDGIEPRIAKTNGVGAYMKAVAKVIAAEQPTRAQRQMLELGISIFARNPLAFHSARKRALHTAMAAHMRDREELGVQLERLSESIMWLFQEARSNE